MDIFPHTTTFDFVGKSKYFIVLSIVLVISSLFIWFNKGMEKYGVDFLGGHSFIIQLPEGKNSDDLRKALDDGGVQEANVQSFEAGSRQYSARFEDAGDSKIARERISGILKSAFPEGAEIVQTDFVGPTVGEELRTKALWAVGLGLLGMLLYVAFRFEFAFGLGAVVAVFHDVIVAMGAYLLTDHTISMATLAAALTIVGYSMNDTIIIFHRVKEELATTRGSTLTEVVNRSINAMLGRTLITHFLTLLSVAALLFLGGGAISDLSMFLFAGMLAGTYSTIYIASPVMMWWHKFRGGTEAV